MRWRLGAAYAANPETAQAISFPRPQISKTRQKSTTFRPATCLPTALPAASFRLKYSGGPEGRGSAPPRPPQAQSPPAPRAIPASQPAPAALPNLMTTVLFNKPYGVLSQFTDAKSPSARPTLSGFGLPAGVYAAGRLDRDSEGLLVLTDDGALQARLSSPKFKTPKTYLVQIEGAPDEAALAPLRNGLTLKDGPTRPASARLIAPPPDLWTRDPPVRFRKSVPDVWMEITISEGRNRQVRRMCAAIGFPCLRLVRWSVGAWSLEGIGQGQWRAV